MRIPTNHVKRHDYEHACIFIEKGKKIGIEKGIEIGKLDVVENLLRNTDFSTVKIAELTGVSEVIVNRILNKINCQK